MEKLRNKKIAVVATDGFEESELMEPVNALKQEGASVDIIAPESKQTIKGWKDHEWSGEIKVDHPISEVDVAEYDALLIPGGTLNADKLRTSADVVGFVEEFFSEGKPVAAICHGPQLLIEAGVVSGWELTSYPSIRTDLENAGANWVDEEVVVDSGLITSRSPSDLPAFIGKMIEEFSDELGEARYV